MRKAKGRRQANTTVSRETRDVLEAYLELLTKWNAKINLVGPQSIEGAWTRHIIDSGQLLAQAPEGVQHWVDLGSGGGLPGLVVAIMARNSKPDMKVTLIESDKRKAVFLSHASNHLGLRTTVLAGRIETSSPQSADVVSARALAPLPDLLWLVKRHLHQEGVAILPKGASHAREIEAARRAWTFSLEEVPSQTDERAVILKIRDIERV